MEQNNYSSSTSTGDGSTQGQSGSAGSNDTQSAGLKDRAMDMAGSAQDKLADVGSSVRDRAGNIKDTLADALETGADKLRSRTQSSGQLAGAGTSGSTAIASDDRMTQVTDRVAGDMEATADWLRDADIDGLKMGLERQVKDHPGRTLLFAVGLGYLLGKALRK
jgi:hypothetical protein